MTLQEIQSKLSKAKDMLEKAKAEGDLRENTAYQEAKQQVAMLQDQLAEQEQAEEIISKLPVKWKPPTVVSDVITMGTLIYANNLDKPVVIVPKFVKHLYESNEYYVCTPSSQFAIQYLGMKITNIRVEVMK